MHPDFDLSDRDFDRVRALIHARAGIALGAQKRQMVYSRLSRRLRELGLVAFGPYLDHLEGAPQDGEWQSFINALTTNLTSFFREAHHFPLLAQHVAGRPHPLQIWCAGASTGEEPYSVAMTLMETLGSRAAACTVLATDVDTEVLAKGQEGVFTMEQVARLPREQLQRFFLKGVGGNEGKALVRPELAAMVKFAPHNLLSPDWPEGPFDAIFCRNVMIYFDKPTQAAILQRFARHMKRGALLFAGHSENFSFLDKILRPRGQTVYGLA
ncbi:chemotaxis protein CheR [Ramlibacter tataouinensis]|uniref:CheR family methyltransferase n=1 Tax=Ramlibacter tataouinensis TaxID=94132 RepID=UPI0022F3AF30|nr:CheR family methyltransferase [Ramlibacter tataouinensis]WBY00579.1 chemotaxis protein CheR [Ramlibacter tataouinensis]